MIASRRIERAAKRSRARATIEAHELHIIRHRRGRADGRAIDLTDEIDVAVFDDVQIVVEEVEGQDDKHIMAKT